MGGQSQRHAARPGEAMGSEDVQHDEQSCYGTQDATFREPICLTNIWRRQHGHQGLKSSSSPRPVIDIDQAAANHIEITEAFARGIVTINDAVKLENLSHVYDSQPLQQLTMRLYTQIFSYLIKFMTWYTERSGKRFLNSFNETKLQLFEDDLTEVKDISNLLSRQIHLHMSADVKVTRIMLEDCRRDLKYIRLTSEMNDRHARLRDAANAELVQNVVRGGLQEIKGEVMETIMQGFNELLRRGLAGEGLTSLLTEQATRDALATRLVANGMCSNRTTRPILIPLLLQARRKHFQSILLFPAAQPIWPMTPAIWKITLNGTPYGRRSMICSHCSQIQSL